MNSITETDRSERCIGSRLNRKGESCKIWKISDIGGEEAIQITYCIKVSSMPEDMDLRHLEDCFRDGGFDD